MSTQNQSKGSGLLPAARLWEVVTGKAPLIGARFDQSAPRGFISPVEARALMGLPYEDLLEAERNALLDPPSGVSAAGVVARTMFARALSPERAALVDRPKIVSAVVNNVTIDDALEAIFVPPNGRARIVHFVHAHALNVARFDRGVSRFFEDADVVLPDGIGVRIAARMLGVQMRHNINGTDLLPLLCTQCAERKIPMVLIGGKPGVAEECADNLRQKTPGLAIPIASHGYLDEPARAAVLGEVDRLGRCVLLVGMGTPIQERWTWEHLTGLKQTTVITVGGLFDFFSERVSRAPIKWRELGLEWLWRLKEEPDRLAKRYLLGNPLFLSLATWQRLTEGPQGKPQGK